MIRAKIVGPVQPDVELVIPYDVAITLIHVADFVAGTGKARSQLQELQRVLGDILDVNIAMPFRPIRFKGTLESV